MFASDSSVISRVIARLSSSDYPLGSRFDAQRNIMARPSDALLRASHYPWNVDLYFLASPSRALGFRLYRLFVAAWDQVHRDRDLILHGSSLVRTFIQTREHTRTELRIESVNHWGIIWRILGIYSNKSKQRLKSYASWSARLIRVHVCMCESERKREKGLKDDLAILRKEDLAQQRY